jgi:hypothetical protein
MKNLAQTIILSLLVSFNLVGLHGQVNLVPNPSFEVYSSCPNNQNQIWKAIGWENFGYTPDYFNACATNPQFGVPSNAVTYQTAASGVAYSGLYTYDSANVNLREFLGIQLSSDLIIGTTYYVSMKAVATLDTISGSNATTNNIGVRFSTVHYDSINAPLVNNFAHVFCPDIISDTSNWYVINGSFVADSAYKYLIIGNFFDDLSISINKHFDNGLYPVAYYFIDDLYVSTTQSTIQDYNNYYQLTLYPVPVSSELNINSSRNIKEAKVMDRYGKVIKTVSPNVSNFSILMDNLSNGVYFIKILFDDNFIATRQIIINN